MTLDELNKILSRGEDLHHEFKKAGEKVSLSFYDTVVAFLNREGGTIVLGADDDGNITGIDPNAVEQMKKDMITALNNKDVINPPVNFPIYQLSENGKTVLCVKIPVSSQIHSHSGIIFDRENDSDIRIEDNARISELYFRKRSHFTENEIYPYLFLKDLDEKLFDKTRAFIRSINPAHPWLLAGNMDILRSCGFYQKDIHSGKEGLTLAAALVFGKDLTIQNIVPAYKFDILVRVKDLDRYDDKLTLRTNLIDTYTQAMDFFKTRAYLPDKFFLEGDQRKDLRELIFREIIANVIVHREYTSAYPTTIAIYCNRVEVSNPNKTLFRGVLSLDTFNPYAKNPNIRKFFSEFRWADEIGSGVKNVYKYLWVYAQSRPVFKEDDLFRTKIPLASAILGKEKAAAFMELVGLDKSRLNDEAISAIESLELAPEYMEIEDFDELFFKKGSCWSEKGSMLKKLRFQINIKLQFDDFKKGACWSEKGSMLFDKRTVTIFKLLLICLTSQHRDDILSILSFNSKDRFRELYLQPLRDEGFIKYTIKDKPKSVNQRYITTEKGRRFLGGFEL
ncbi:MAG: putative DNA binding domain-containing protein [Dysgonamonadaceae bacterium]|jgi:predicted HTH transcriptional regulator|nr:putative DNA binding domain-containing protein [Dysgonamonadaceae bacterium]